MVTTEEPPALFELEARTHARRSDPGTSYAAASRLHAAAMMRRLLRAYVHVPEGLTAEEAADHCGFAPASGAWKRVSDLAARGWIADTGTVRLARSGRYQLVRTVTDEGRRIDREAER